MLSKIQIISTVGSLCFLLIIFYTVRQKKLKEAYAILWIFSGIIMLVLSVWTNCLRVISDLIGIVYPPATLFLFLLCGIILENAEAAVRGAVRQVLDEVSGAPVRHLTFPARFVPEEEFHQLKVVNLANQLFAVRGEA